MLEKSGIRKTVIGIGVIPLALVFVLGIVSPEGFNKIMWGIVNTLCDNLGWLINVGTIFSIFFTLFFLISKYGKIKFGGPNAKPEFSTFSWWAISLCAGMGMGIVMFPPAEVIEYAFRPPVEMFLEPGSYQASYWAGQVTMMHWTVALYGIYVAAGLICGYVYYNMKQSFSVTSTLYPAIGKKANKFSEVIDGIIVFAIVGGVAGSLGYGILQVSDGINQIFGITIGKTSWIIVTIVITAIYTLSSVSGLKKGIQWLGNKNAILFIGMLAFVAIFGPTKFSLEWGTRVTGGVIENLFTNALYSSPFFIEDQWDQWWNWLWFMDYFIFAPTTGLFLARLSKGRTIREFVTVNMVAPCIFSTIWCILFGGLATHAQWIEKIDLFKIINEKGIESVMLRLFEQLPLPILTKPLMLVIILISFITLANAVTSTIAKMCMKDSKAKDDEENDDAPAGIQIFWGVFMGAIALLFLLSGGLEGCKVLKLFVGFPILFFQLAVMIGFLKMFIKKESAEKFKEVEEIIYHNENMIE